MLDKLIDILKNKKTILFCGAGISYNSRAPTVKPLIKYILQRFDIQADHIERYLDLHYPFEGFIERLRNHIDVKPLLDVFDVENPNLNHFFIAKCLKAGLVETVITTNFDRNIELALDDEKVLYEKIFQTDDLNKIDFRNGIPKVIKIHGSIEDKDRLGIEINLIASSKHIDKLRALINFAFLTGKHDYVVFMGYSFSDSFDVLPLINEISKSGKRIIIIDHAGNIPDQDFFGVFEHVEKFKINTDDLIQNLHLDFFGSPKPLSSKSFN